VASGAAALLVERELDLPVPQLVVASARAATFCRTRPTSWKAKLTPAATLPGIAEYTTSSLDLKLLSLSATVELSESAQKNDMANTAKEGQPNICATERLAGEHPEL
jgi:hypothetical protein